MKQLFTSAIFAFCFISVHAQITLSHLSTYHTNVFDEGSAETITYDKLSKRLFFSNANENSIGVLDFSDPSSISLLTEIDLSSFGAGVNSVSSYNGNIAVAVEGDGTLDRGRIVFFDSSGTYLSDVEAGYLPDMVTFSHDGLMVVAANEGEPNDEWTEDPPGSVTIIDLSGGILNLSQSNVTEIVLGDYTGSWDDVRIFGQAIPFEGDFQNEDTINYDSVFVDWNQYNLAGNSRQWHEFNYPSGSDTIFSRISGYDGGCQHNEDFLISTPISLDGFDKASLSFESAYNFSGPGLELWIATDFDGSNVNGATWVDHTNDATWPSAANYTWQHSGEIDMSDYLGEEVHIAFRYTSTDSTGCSTWEVDEVIVTGGHDDEDNLEPEYVAISNDNQTAFVALQENNALAVIDLSSKSISSIVPFGTKDHSINGNGMDASNEDGEINITTYPFKGLYLPDAIASTDIDGATYVFTANEGDSRDYDAYSEEERLKDLDLDPTNFPDAETLQEEENGGRIKVTTSMGDTDGDGDYDEIYTYGGRSFSIWTSSGALVYDSGDEFEQEIAAAFPNDFNSTNDENDSFDNRSDDKGPEPEAIEVAKINGSHYAFIGCERVGGIMVYDVSTPASSTFVQYINNRDFEVSDVETEAVGDLGVEDIIYIAPTEAGDTNAYIVTSNEVSGTVSVFRVSGAVGVNELQNGPSFNAYPNPTHTLLRISVEDDYRIIDLTGRVVRSVENTKVISLVGLENGVYIIQNDHGQAQTVVKN